jgi:hypothetical protein
VEKSLQFFLCTRQALTSNQARSISVKSTWFCIKMIHSKVTMGVQRKETTVF